MGIKGRFFAKVFGEEIKFEDPALEDALRKFVLDPGPWLRIPDVDDLVELDLSNKGIRSLKGIEAMPGLRAIDLSGNKINDLTPLTKIERLEEVDLSNNGITDIGPLAGYTYIKRLNLSGNSITDCTPLSLCNKDLSELDLITRSGILHRFPGSRT